MFIYVQVITFDGYGVSGHPNHRSVCEGVLHLCREKESLNVFLLESVSLLRKYSTFADSLPALWARYCCVVDHVQRARIQVSMVDIYFEKF